MSNDNPAKALADLIAVATTMESVERSYTEDDEETLRNLADRIPYVVSHWRTTIEGCVQAFEKLLAPAAGMLDDEETEQSVVN